MMYPEDDVLLTAGMDVVVLTRLLLYGEPAVQNVLKHRLSCPQNMLPSQWQQIDSKQA
jgi:hypothetical protein